MMGSFAISQDEGVPDTALARKTGNKRRMERHLGMRRFKVCLALLLIALPCLASAGLHKVDINNASESALINALEGVAQQEARAIVDYRRVHGAFRSVEQLALVKGLDLGVVERNRERIVLGSVRDRMDLQAERRKTRQ